MMVRFCEAFRISQRKELYSGNSINRKYGGTPMQEARSLRESPSELPGQAWCYTGAWSLELELGGWGWRGACPASGTFVLIVGPSALSHQMETSSKARRLCKSSPQAAREALTLLRYFHLFSFSFSYLGLELIWHTA